MSGIILVMPHKLTVKGYVSWDAQRTSFWSRIYYRMNREKSVSGIRNNKLKSPKALFSNKAFQYVWNDVEAENQHSTSL